MKLEYSIQGRKLGVDLKKMFSNIYGIWKDYIVFVIKLIIKLYKMLK